MTRFVVDTDVMCYVQRTRSADTWIAHGPMPLVVTDQVWSELVAGPAANGEQAQADEMEKMLKSAATAPVIISAGSQEAQCVAHLSSPSRLQAGEISVIAYAYCHADCVAVLLDRKAVQVSIEELRGRTLSVHGFLDAMVTGHGFNRSLAEKVSDQLLKRQSHLAVPMWW